MSTGVLCRKVSSSICLTRKSATSAREMNPQLQRPQAEEARHWLASCDPVDFEQQLSPSGNPLMCCRVRVVGVVPASDTTRSVG